MRQKEALRWLAYVPRHVADELARAPLEGALQGEQRLDATVLFADISGFTPMSEVLARAGRRGTEELTVILNAYFQTMIGVIDLYGGSVGKFGGDALTVLFPFTARTRGRVGERALQCALDMQAAMSRFAEIQTVAGVFPLQLKIGLAAGPVLLTTVGDPAIRLEYLLAGTALDLSAAAEHRAVSGEVVAHQDLVELTSPLIGERRGEFATVSGLHTRPSPARKRPVGEPPPGAIATLERFLHPSVADRVRAGLGPFVNEHRSITTLFVGFAGFDYADPGVSGRLQNYFEDVVRTINRFDGHLRQIEMGDKGSKYIVFFGAPVAHENDEERALRCALELLTFEGARELRIGVATGPTYCGEVGAASRREYAGIGDTVNLSARLMQAASAGEILAAGAPRPVLARTFELANRSPARVKGKSSPVPVFVVTGLRRRSVRLEEREYDTPLVGRRLELSVAHERLEAAAQGHGQIISIAGEAGLGKSRFSAELVRHALALGFEGHSGAAQQSGGAATYLLWHAVWRSFFSLDVSSPSNRQLQQLKRSVRRLDESVGSRLPLLGPALGLSISDNRLTVSLDAELRAEALRSMLVTCLAARARSTPVFLLLEDCHWNDPLSDDLLVAIGRSIETIPVLLVTLHRPPADKASPVAWASSLPNFTEIVLSPLPAEDVNELVRLKAKQLFDLRDEQPSAGLDRLAARAEGNAFYLEELLNLVRARGIDPSDERALASMELPETLQTLVMARLDELPAAEQTTLKVASVIGRRFKAFWLWGSYPQLGTPNEVRKRLKQTSRLDLTTPARLEPELEYLFRHVVVRDVAYESLTFALRQNLHEWVGSFVETRYAREVAQHVHTLAHHYGESKNRDKQQLYFRRAAEAAKANFANDAALSYLERLLPLTSESERPEVLRNMGEIHQLVGSWPSAENAFRAGLELATSSGDAGEEAQCRCALGHLLSYTKSFGEGRTLLEAALIEFEARDDGVSTVRALEYLAFLTLRQADYARSLDYSQEHLRLALEIGDAVAASLAVEQMGIVYRQTGEYALARDCFEDALRGATEARHLRGIIHAGNDLAGLHFELGEFRAAFARLRQALEAAEQIGHRPATAWMVSNAGELYRLYGDYRGALRCYAHAFGVTAELRDWSRVLAVGGNLAVALAEEGRFLLAERLFERVIALGRVINSPYLLSDYLHNHAKAVNGLGRPSEARPLNDEALAISTEIGRRDIRFPAEVLAIRLRLELGEIRPEQAVRELDALAKDWPEPREQAALQYARWQIDPDDATARRRAARLYKALHTKTPDVEFRKRYAELTGKSLSEPEPLPRLIETDEEVDVEEILTQLEALQRELEQISTPVSA